MTSWKETVGNSTPAMGQTGASLQTGQQIGENVYIENIQVPTSIKPNQRLPFSYEVRVATDLNFTHPDWCPRPLTSLQGSGLSAQITESFGGQNRSFNRCLDEEGATTAFSSSFFSPSQEGQYTLTIQVNGQGTGTVYELHETQVEVSESSPDPIGCPRGFTPDPETGQCIPTDDGDGGGDGGQDGGNGQFDLGSFVVNNPVEAGVLGIGGLVAVRTLTETLVAGE